MKEQSMLFFGTISEMLEHVAEGLKTHDTANIPDICYRQWIGLVTFQGETYQKIGDFDLCTTSFRENGSLWELDTYLVAAMLENGTVWGERFVNSIRKDGVEIAYPKLPFVDYIAALIERK